MTKRVWLFIGVQRALTTCIEVTPRAQYINNELLMKWGYKQQEINSKSSVVGWHSCLRVRSTKRSSKETNVGTN